MIISTASESKSRTVSFLDRESPVGDSAVAASVAAEYLEEADEQALTIPWRSGGGPITPTPHFRMENNLGRYIYRQSQSIGFWKILPGTASEC